MQSEAKDAVGEANVSEMNTSAKGGGGGGHGGHGGHGGGVQDWDYSKIEHDALSNAQ